MYPILRLSLKNVAAKSAQILSWFKHWWRSGLLSLHACSLRCRVTLLFLLFLGHQRARSSTFWEDWPDWGLKICSRFSRSRSKTTPLALLMRLCEELTVSCNSSSSLMNAACFHPIATTATWSENGSCCRSSPNLMFRTIAAISFCKQANQYSTSI